MTTVTLDPSCIDDYRKFLAIKELPKYTITGRTATFPDEYASRIGLVPETKREAAHYPPEWMFDYQRAIASMAIRKKKFAVFADCGLGKTAILLEFAKHAWMWESQRRPILIVSPLMVVRQTLAECERFYGHSLPIRQIAARELAEWTHSGKGIGITNYDALDDEIEQGRLGGLILDESSMLKSHYGKWGQKCIELGRGLEWKLCLTGTPAPNDRIEYANHAVFLDHFPTVNAFLARFFVNRGQTDNRWELKPHALRPFYEALSHWCIFLTNPATYGWKDNTAGIPPINVHLDNVPMTGEQIVAVQDKTGGLFPDQAGGITSRSRLSQIAKGNDGERKIDSNKPRFIRQLVDSWPDESTIIWCHYNREQETMEATFPEAASISGDTPYERREEIIADFKAGRIRILISKPRILGFGLNLQICTRQVFSGLQDSYEEYYQAVKRSNRIGSKRALHVHIPFTDIEAPMIDNVLRKAKRVQHDTEEQERIFHAHRIG